MPNVYVSILLVRVVLSELRKRGLEEKRVLSGTVAVAERLSDLHARVAVEDWRRILQQAVELSGDPAFALLTGGRASVGSLQLYGQLLRSAPTLRDAANVFLRYTPLLAEHLQWSLEESGTRARLKVQGSPADKATIELALGMAYEFGRRLAPPRTGAQGVELEFAHFAPAHSPQAYRDEFSCFVSFGRAQNALVFPRELLDQPRPVVLDDGITLELLRQHAEKLLFAHSQGSVVARARSVLLNKADLSQFDVGQLARSLGLTERVLRRRLADEGVPLASLLNEVRVSIALREIATPGIAIKQLSERLGFSEPSAFHRAFKRWTGKTPVEYLRGPSDATSAVFAYPGEDALADASRSLQVQKVSDRGHAFHP